MRRPGRDPGWGVRSRIDTGIPQGSLISPILYLFYSADLLESCQSRRYRTSAIRFVADVSALTYGSTMEGNCQNLERIHEACEKWAKNHGSKFAAAKYKLIHFARKPKRFNMTASVKISSPRGGPGGFRDQAAEGGQNPRHKSK